VVSRVAPQGINIVLGDGAGGFLAGTPIELSASDQPKSPCLIDLNSDRLLDLAFVSENPYVSEGGHHLNVAIGSGDGTFGPMSRMDIGLPGDLVSLDANGDGRTDLAAIHEGAAIALFLGLGNGQFSPKVDFGVGSRIGRMKGMVLADNGRTDLVLTATNEDRLVVLHNRGTFIPVDRPPVVTAPEAVDARAGSRVQIDVSASDPDGDAIKTLSADLTTLPPGNDAAFTVGADRASGSLAWTTQAADVGTYSIRFVAGNSQSGFANTHIEVRPENRPPVADAGGPYTGVVDVPVAFDGSGSSDPDGDPLSMSWEFGDGATASGAQPLHAYRAAGDYPVTLHVGDGRLSSSGSAVATIGTLLPARVFPALRNRIIFLAQRIPGATFQLEPVAQSFRLEEVDVSSITLRRRGPNSSVEIQPSTRKLGAVRDRDRNGVDEISLFFEQHDLRRLFGWILGTRAVPLRVEGALLSGARFGADFQVLVHGYLRFPHVAVTPNPMNPEATFTVVTAQGGRLRADLFDARGRLVRHIMDVPNAAPGFYEVRVDGRAEGGGLLASGVYFYRVESSEGTVEGRVVVVR
ncbi:MAG: PKD domain-containing protein, partial [Candidatus Eiseniibacteriota bacterium]